MSLLDKIKRWLQRQRYEDSERDVDISQPLGSYHGSNKRVFIAQKQLFETWQKEYSKQDCPISKPLGYFPLPGTGDGIVAVDYTDRFTVHRLSKLEYLRQEQYADMVDVAEFSSNVFKTVRIAHKRLSASFTNEAGSGLSIHNVTLDGEIKDLETFRSPVLGDPPASRNEMLEDLRIGIESLEYFCKKLATDHQSAESLLATCLNVAYAAYAGGIDSAPSNRHGFEVAAKELLKVDVGLPSRITPSGVTALTIAATFLDESIPL
jgi:hypothetical protein